MTTCRLSEIIGPAFAESHHAVKSGVITELVEKGGRGGGKSSFISVEVLLLLLKHPECHAVVMRRVGNTLRSSVYAQICWAIAALGLTSRFKCTVSPMECTYVLTGQKIMFFGLDDPGKLKSIKVPFGHIGVGWFEELDQFAGPEQVRNVEQSIFRGGQFSFCFKSFNPPATARNWANRYVLEDKPGKLVHHSTYLDMPGEWLGPRFIADAEHLKETNPAGYRHEYGGEPTGDGGNVFDNIETRRITDDEIACFDRIYQGIDWGYYPDPFAFVRIHYDVARETLFFIDEVRTNKTSNQANAEEIRSRGYRDFPITCDSAEPKSVADMRACGLDAHEAVKGPGSVEYGMKWLQARKLVIDPRRTPHACKELTEYEYERDKDGNIISGYPDENNHFIDASRYAMERVFRIYGVKA